MTSQRSYQLEWIDLGPAYYTADEYRQCLYQLDRIGRFLGGDRATFLALQQLKTPLNSILDVGCGGGLFTMRLATHYPQARVLGIDISPEAIAFAQEHLNQFNTPLTNIEFSVPSTPQLDHFSESFDVVTSTLVCHHLSDTELISFLQQACRIANRAVILNDLHRYPLASIGFATLVPIFFRNRLIWHDGLLSIRRAFTRQDWLFYLDRAGIDQEYYTITWHWAFRWVVTIDTAAMKNQKRESKIKQEVKQEMNSIKDFKLKKESYV